MRTFIAIVLTLGTFSLSAQTDNTEKIAGLLGTGNSKALSGYFTPNVDLTVVETDDVYSKAQAEQILKKFFEENPPSTFKIEHDGKTKAGDRYVIGTLSTSKGKFRVTYFLKQINDAQLIKQLRIEESSDEIR